MFRFRQCHGSVGRCYAEFSAFQLGHQRACPGAPAGAAVRHLRTTRAEDAEQKGKEHRLSSVSVWHLFVEQVVEDTDELSRAAWVSAQQRVNLNRLRVATADCSPALCCQRANSLDTTVFLDANKVLHYQVGHGKVISMPVVNFPAFR